MDDVGLAVHHPLRAAECIELAHDGCQRLQMVVELEVGAYFLRLPEAPGQPERPIPGSEACRQAIAAAADIARTRCSDRLTVRIEEYIEQRQCDHNRGTFEHPVQEGPSMQILQSPHDHISIRSSTVMQALWNIGNLGCGGGLRRLRRLRA